jgi:DNA-binding CsgD family transcriptional regulator/tetratricopeptide (TPR) repeat protein
VFAARDGCADKELAGLPELIVTGLPDAQARALLDQTLPGLLDANVRDTILAEAAGNPLAILELQRALTPADMAGGYGLASATRVAARIEQSFSDHFHHMPESTRMLLLVAAAEPAGEPSWLWAAATYLGVTVGAAAPAEVAGLISNDGRVRFSHPLVRSAVYHGAAGADRRRAHDALAKSITGATAEDYRTWHRAHATGAPDEAVADALVRSAQRARIRGGIAAAASFLSLATERTPDPTQRACRALDAAQAKLDAGDAESASRLLTVADEVANDPLLCGRIDVGRAMVAFAARRGRDAPPLLMSAAAKLELVDAGLARDTHLAALMAATVVGRLSVGEDYTACAVARAARTAPAAPEPARATDLLLDALIVRFLDGYVAAAPLLRAAIERLLAEEHAGTADPRWHDITNRVLLDLFDQDTYYTLAARQVDTLRATGALTLLPVALTTCAGECVVKGRFSDAAALLEEAEVITTAVGAPPQRYIEPYLAAYRGDEPLATKLIQESLDGAHQRGEGFAITVALTSRAILHTSLGNYDKAHAACQSALEYDDLGMTGYVLVEAVEAAARCDEHDSAATALGILTTRAQASDTTTALGVAARSRALLSEGPDAETHYREAIDFLTDSPVLTMLARTHLVYGEWLRRVGRRVDARAELQTAHRLFATMGADGFTDRTRRELRATGATVRDKPTGTAVILTTQEKYITRLAGKGYTNSEIAGQLFVSPRTVEWHLGKIFTKLNVSSRRGLRDLTIDLL